MALALPTAVPAVAQAGWSRPFDLVAPGTLDDLPTRLALSAGGTAAAALTIENVDVPGSQQGYLVNRSATGTVGAPLAITGVRQVLALTFTGQSPTLLTGTSPGGLDCCSSAQVLRIGPGGVPGRPQTVVGGLAGATIGQLVPLAGGRLLAAVATGRGVWTAQSRSGYHFSDTRMLTGQGQAAVSLSATGLGGQDSLVAWTAASGPAGFADPRSIFYALGTRTGGPRHAHTLTRVAVGHRVDQLVVGRRGSTATAAWLQSYFDARGGFHSEVQTADFIKRPKVLALSPALGDASGMAFAANSSGAQAVAYKTCAGSACTVHAVTRDAKGGFTGDRVLGPIDSSQDPAVAVGPRGRVLVAWVRGGRPVAAAGTTGRSRFGSAQALSGSVYALDITMAFGPRRGALVAWTQGTLNPSVVAVSG